MSLLTRIIILGSYCLLILVASADERNILTPTSTASNQILGKELELKHTEEHLVSILETITTLDARIKNLSLRLASGNVIGQEDALKSEILLLSEQRSSLNRNLEEIITGVDANLLIQEPDDENLDLGKEFSSLLGPLLIELKKITSRPREIEKLRREEANLTSRQIATENSIANIDQTLKTVKDRTLKTTILRLRDKWVEQRQAISTEIKVIKQKLDQKVSEQVPISTSFEQIFQLFFQSRGRNLLIAILTSVLFFISLNQLQTVLQRQTFFKKQLQRFEFRLFGIALHLFAIIGASLIFLIVLYLFDDWLLLLLFSTMILFTIWSSRTAVARFWRQITLILNVGPIREGEIVVFQNIPWRVDRLNLYCRLTNPKLKGGRIRVTANNILNLQSRQPAKNELFFPTVVDDWILLGPHDLLGKIEIQTPELVAVRLLGGGVKYFRTSSFIDQSPVVLTGGFRHNITFGLDYRHQADLQTVIFKTIRKFLIEKIQLTDWGRYLKTTAIEALPPRSSDLAFAVICDFEGAAAPSYDKIKRFLAGILIECATVNNWVIPVNQVVVHQPYSGIKEELATKDQS